MDHRFGITFAGFYHPMVSLIRPRIGSDFWNSANLNLPWGSFGSVWTYHLQPYPTTCHFFPHVFCPIDPPHSPLLPEFKVYDGWMAQSRIIFVDASERGLRTYNVFFLGVDVGDALNSVNKLSVRISTCDDQLGVIMVISAPSREHHISFNSNIEWGFIHFLKVKTLQFYKCVKCSFKLW